MRCLASAGSVSFLFLGQFYRNSPLRPTQSIYDAVYIRMESETALRVEVRLHYPFVSFPLLCCRRGVYFSLQGRE
jgi:hypothetical protein